MLFLRRIALGIRGFISARTATSAVEFAIILPAALLLYVGAAEVSDGVLASRKSTMVTRTLVDLLSQQATSAQAFSTPAPPNALSATTLSTLMTASGTLLYPEPTSSLTMTLSAIDITNTMFGICCTATVRWSFTQNGSLRPCNILLTGGPLNSTDTGQIPSQLLPIGTPLPQPVSLLVADVSYTYQPLMSTRLLNFVPSMQRTEYMFPRSTGQVVTGSLPAAGAQYGKVCY